jgi:hypothetical protein
MKIVIFPIGTKCDLQNELIWTIYLPLVKKDISKMDQIKKKNIGTKRHLQLDKI